jgi:SAM-dependent methyltransferase
VRDLTAADWQRLSELRATFLDERAHADAALAGDYWSSRRDLELYDRTFGTRVAWKWRAVLSELALRGIAPPTGRVLDWGCGTGVAAREYLRAFGARSARTLVVWDRSAPAAQFARERIAGEQPHVDVALALDGTREPVDVLLASHVLGELDARGVAELASIARGARFVICVEPGSRAVSRRLSALRDELLDDLEALAPCTHSAGCGALAAGEERSWCHHFARPPAEAFQSRHWAEFSRTLGIDLRSLPYSFVVLSRREALDAASAAPTTPHGTVRARIIGRPRVEKGRARVDACDVDGVHEWSLLKREDRALHDALADSAGDCLVFDWTIEGGRIRAPRRAFGASPRSPRSGADVREAAS